MDWTQIVSSVVAVSVLLIPSVGWLINTVNKLDRRCTVLETRDEPMEGRLDRITRKVSSVADDVQIIKISIAKIETTLQARADDNSAPPR